MKASEATVGMHVYQVYESYGTQRIRVGVVVHKPANEVYENPENGLLILCHKNSIWLGDNTWKEWFTNPEDAIAPVREKTIKRHETELAALETLKIAAVKDWIDQLPLPELPKEVETFDPEELSEKVLTVSETITVEELAKRTASLTGSPLIAYETLMVELNNHLGSPEAARLWLVTPHKQFKTTPLDAIMSGEAELTLAYIESKWNAGPFNS